MTLAADPLAPQRDLSVTELRSGYGYGSGVSYVGGVPNPAGVRSGVVTIVTTAAGLVSAVAAANFGDDIVIPNGTANAITISTSMVTFPALTTITAATPRQAPPPMMDYSSGAGLAIAAPKPMSAAPPALTAPNVPVAALATMTPQGDPSYVRIMSGQAELVTNPPPHTTWHTTNYQRFAHLIQGDSVTAILGTPDTWTHYDHNHFRMEGIRFVNHAGNGIGFYVSVGSSNAQVTNTGSFRSPDHFIFDRVYLDGDVSGNGVVPASLGSNRGISGQFDYFGLLNSRSHGMWRTASGDYNLEANTIAPTGSLGPLHLENNWLTGAGEITLANYGNNAALPAPYITSDATYTRNWLIRPLTWRETFHYNAVPPNQTGQARVSLDAGGTTLTMSFTGGSGLFGSNADMFEPGDLFWTATSGRPVQISAYTSESVCTLLTPYTENAGASNLTGVFAVGRQVLDGSGANLVNVGGTGNRTVTSSSGTTVWLTTLKPYVDNPPPGCGVFFGVNTNLMSQSSNQKIYPVMAQIVSVDSDTQLTLGSDYTSAIANVAKATSWTNQFYTVSLWDGNTRSVMKNLHEWKSSNRIRLVGNVLENAWATFNGQGANAVAFNAPSSGGGFHRDGYVGYNLFVNTGLHVYYVGLAWTTFPPPQDPSLLTSRRFLMEHNLIVDAINYQWQANESTQPSINSLTYTLNPGGFDIAAGSAGPADWQFRHNTALLSTDYQRYFRMLNPSTQSASDIFNRFVFRDNILHVGDHAVGISLTQGGFVGGSTNQANADTYDADGMLGGTNPLAAAYPTISTDSVVAGNVFLRHSGSVVAAHTTSYGGLNAGFINETSVAFTNYGNAANIPRWLTQSVVPSDYALTTVYQTDAGACTITGSTVTISSGTIPTTVGPGTPFRLITDTAAVMARVGTRTSATQVALTAPYSGTTGAGLTGLFSFVGAATDGTTSTLFVSATGAATVTNLTSVTVTESFTHADEASLSGLDNVWTQPFGTHWGITSNAAALQGTSSVREVAVCQTSLRSPDHFCSAVLATYTQTSNAQGGVYARSNAAGTKMYFFHAAPASTNQFEFGTVTNGVSSTLNQYNGTTAAAGQGLKLTVTGSAYTCEINNVVVMSGTDTSVTTGNFVGIDGFRGAAGDAVAMDTLVAQTTTPLTAALVSLTGDQFPVGVTPTGVFTRSFLASGDAASAATPLASYDSATQVVLSALYPGTTGAGLTAIITGLVPTGQDPGINTTAVLAAVAGIRT